MKLGVVVPLFNHLPQTQAMLASLQSTLPKGMPHEIVLVDDGSTDGTRDWLGSMARSPGIRVVMNAANLGFGQACMAGVAGSDADVLAFLNNDLVLRIGWLEPMWTLLLDPARNAGVVGNLQHRVDNGTLDHAGITLTPEGELGHVRTLPLGSPPARRVLAVTGACLLVRRIDFEAVGGFDARYRNGGEDVDLCFKLRECDKDIWLSMTSRVDHHVRSSRGPTSIQDERNSRALYSRWRPQIKRELHAAWLRLLHAAPGESSRWLPGHLTADFSRTPNAAALALAEAALQRLEHRWGRLLDGVDPNDDLPRRVLVSGLDWQPDAGAWMLQGEACFTIGGLRSARDFYVCGWLADGWPAQGLEITVSANGLHERTLPLGPPGHVNVGLVDPLVLPLLTANRFSARVTRPDPCVAPADRQAVAGAVWVTHLVVDGRTVDELPRTDRASRREGGFPTG
jgi:GT2 family glycosyltransferase